MDMDKSMISNSSLSIPLCIDALQTVMYLLNKIPSKVVSKIHYELELEENLVYDIN